MKFSQILTSLLLLSVATARTTKSKTSQTSESKAPKTTKGCGGTNCNRAIYGTHQNVASRYSDCLSYFSTTVTAPQRSARCQRAKQSLQYNGINSTSTSTVTVYTILGNDAYVPPQTVKKRDGPTVTVSQYLASYIQLGLHRLLLSGAGCSCEPLTYMICSDF